MLSRVDDSAVSASIASIILVAVAVIAFGATYVALSSFGATSAVPPQGLQLTSESHAADGLKAYVVPHATPGMRWQDVLIIVEGTALTQSTAPGCPTPNVGQWIVCKGSDTLGTSSLVEAGSMVNIRAEPGESLRVVDAKAGTLVLETEVR